MAAQDNRSRNGMLIISVVFLLASLVVAGWLLFPYLVNIPPATAIEPTQQITAETSSETPIPSQDPAPTIQSVITSWPEAPWVAISGSDEEFDEAFIESFTQILAESSARPDIIVLSVEPGTTLSDLNAYARMLITVTSEPDTLVSVRFYTPPGTPPFAGVAAPPQAWLYTSPADTELIVSPDDHEFAGYLAASALELDEQNSAGAITLINRAQGVIPALDAASTNQNDSVLLFLWGTALQQSGDLSGALRMFSQAIRQDAYFPAALNNRGAVYLAFGDLGTALNGFELATTQQEETQQGVADNRLLYNQALVALSAEDLETASQQTAQLDMASSWAIALAAAVDYHAGNYLEAAEKYRSLRASLSGSPDPVRNETLALLANKSYEEALMAADDLLLLVEADIDAYLLRTEALEGLDRLEEAIQTLEEVLIIDETHIDTMLWQGRLTLGLNDPDEAITIANEVLVLDATNQQAYQLLGDAYLMQEAWQLAFNAYNDAEFHGADSALFYANRGWAAHRIRFTGGAINDYRQALELGVDAPELFYRLGFALFDAGQTDSALDAFTAAINGGLDSAEANAALALALDASVKREEAEQAYARAIELDERYADVDYLSEQPLWTYLAVVRAEVIMRRMGVETP